MAVANGDWTPITADAFRAAVEARFARRDERLAQAGGDHVLNPGIDDGYRPPRDAAVLIPVIDRPGGASVLFTLRSNELRDHKGQIAFPGGKIDAGDASPQAAALREASEEVGIGRDDVEVVGQFADYLSRTGFRVSPVVGIVHPQVEIVPEPGEVADVFEVPLGFLMSEASHRHETMHWKGLDRHFWAMPWEDERAGERRIWGLTAGIIRMVWERVYADAVAA